MEAKKCTIEVKGKLEEIPELPDNFVLIVTGPSLTNKKKLIESLERKGCLKLPSFTTKPKTYEAEDFYVRVKEEEWEDTIKENFVCKTSIHGYKYALNWMTLQSMLKTKRPVIVSLDPRGLNEFMTELTPKLKGLCLISILCRDRDVLNIRLAQYCRKNLGLSEDHINSLAYRLLSEHISYEQMQASIKILMLHDNNIEETSQTIINEIVNANLDSVPEVEINNERIH